jgi:hypothetical protein
VQGGQETGHDEARGGKVVSHHRIFARKQEELLQEWIDASLMQADKWRTSLYLALEKFCGGLLQNAWTFM